MRWTPSLRRRSRRSVCQAPRRRASAFGAARSSEPAAVLTLGRSLVVPVERRLLDLQRVVDAHAAESTNEAIPFVEPGLARPDAVEDLVVARVDVGHGRCELLALVLRHGERGQQLLVRRLRPDLERLFLLRQLVVLGYVAHVLDERPVEVAAGEARDTLGRRDF